MSSTLRKLLPHGRRAVTAAVVAVLVLVSVGFMARAELGSAPASDSSATPSGEAGSGGNGDDNVAVAINDKDGKTVYSVRLKVVLTGKDTVDAANAAVAAASCSDCTTVALALEGVVVWGEPETVVPVNLALAMNTECDNCQTLAAAYQYVTSADGRVRITGEGRRTIAMLRKQLSGLRTSGLSVVEVKAEADRIAAEFYRVLQEEVVPIGKPAGTFPAPGATPTEFAQDTPGDAAGTVDDGGAPAEGDATTTASTPPSPTPSETASSTSPTPSPSPTSSTTP